MIFKYTSEISAVRYTKSICETILSGDTLFSFSTFPTFFQDLVNKKDFIIRKTDKGDHVYTSFKNGSKAPQTYVAIGDYILEYPNGDLDIMSEKKFKSIYSQKEIKASPKDGGNAPSICVMDEIGHWDFRSWERKPAKIEEAGFQRCPICNGTGVEEVPNMYLGTVQNSKQTCTTCRGLKIISMVTGLPPN